MMNENIAKAFIKAKKDFAPALKTSTNPHFKSRYADLSACLEAVDDSFLANGIVMYQETFEDNTGVTVETVLLHETGETIRGGKLHVPASKQDPQGYGSALTYVRRYSLMATCGIAQEDDDGQAASKPKAEPIKPSPAPNLVPPPLSKTELDDAIQYMNGCTDMESLKGVFGAAYKRAGDLQKKTLTDVYNAKKALLEKAA